MDKKELRNQGRTTAKDTKDKHGADYDQQITDRFFASQHFMPRSHISLFMALKGEVSCMNIIKKLGQQGHMVCLPVIMGPSEPMIFREYFLGDSTRPGMMGQHEPLDNAADRRYLWAQWA
jgi:5,10-methenyltetrahydrofolate synthetase